MNEDELTKINDMINVAVIKRISHNEPSTKTLQFMSEFSTKFKNVEDKLDCLITEVKTITERMLCKEDAKEIYVTKNEFLFLKGRNSFYAVITPLLTGGLGALISYILFK
jgi:hypothetical protein